ncbi:MAG: hypothetical protein KGY66_07110 [Candidatus Thermoplasmatota archaeon]|nr:hypothetical protein [Candidatus Thermoplasmatota archaeon]
MIYTILNLGLAIILLFWMNLDISRKDMGRKYYWGWMLGVVIGYFFLTLLGVIIVVIVYYAWSRFYHTKIKG